MSGKLDLFIYDKSGNLIERHSNNNLIVTSGYQSTVEALAGAAGAVVSKIGVGTNNVAPALSDTTLQNMQSFTLTGVEYPVPLSVRFNFSVGFGDANGMDICEWGLVTADNRLYSRLTREYIQKTNEIMILGSWTINI